MCAVVPQVTPLRVIEAFEFIPRSRGRLVARSDPDIKALSI